MADCGDGTGTTCTKYDAYSMTTRCCSITDSSSTIIGSTCYSRATEVCCGDGRGKKCPYTDTYHHYEHPQLYCCIGSESTTCYDYQTEQCCPGTKNGDKCPNTKNCCVKPDGTANCCDPAACEDCNWTTGVCESRCPDCQTCDGAGNCRDCDPNHCETCIDGKCVVCGGDPTATCRDGHCCCAANGCGACGGPSIPDNPTGCSDTSFLDACNAHDTCYATCDNDLNHKTVCDNAFFITMLNVCDGSNPACTTLCIIAANAYFNGVFWGGGSGYATAQNCSSCP
jgi:hypothetical protein